MPLNKPDKNEQDNLYQDKSISEVDKKAKQDRLNSYIDDFTRAKKYVSENYHDKWYDCWKLFNNKRVKIGYNSIADSFVPETRTIVESLVANIAGGAPRFEYIPTNEEQAADTKVLSELMNYYWDCNHMGTKAQSWVRDSILYGTGILHVTWDAKRNIPQIDNVPLRDFFIDPTATTLENARFAGFRYLADRETLKKIMVVDPETGEKVRKYKNLDLLNGADLPGNNADEMDKSNKEHLLGSTLGTNDARQIEVVLMYYMDEGEEKLVEIANRTTIIREVDTPYQMEERVQDVEVTGPDGMPQTVPKTIEPIAPFLPFAVLRNVIDSSLFYATGDVEVIMDRQETLNDVENLDMDNFHYINNVMWRIDPAYEDMAAEIESTPGIVIPIPRNALEPIEKPTISTDMDNKKQEIKDEMRRATAADEIMQGVQAGARTTATEISAVTTQAMARFKTKVTNLESEGFAQLGSVLFKMSQIFIDQKTVVRIVGPEGTSFKDFDPFEYSGYYEPHVKLDSTVKQQKEERGMKDNQLFQLIVNNPVVNQQEAIRMIAKHLDANDEDINRLLTPPQQPMATPGGGPMPLGGGVPTPPQGTAQPGQEQGAPQVDPEEVGRLQAQQDFAQMQG